MGKPPQKKNDTTPVVEGEVDTFEAVVDKQIGDLVPQGARKAVVSRITTVLMSEQFSGPIAHPRHLEKYERIQSGAADRIISMAEAQQVHHIEMDQRIVAAEVADRKLGMWLGAGTFALLIACALLSAIFTDSEIIPGFFLGTAALGGVTLLIKGRSNGNGTNR
ncbi:DUF2335 domain-containing protein [Aliiroseovarius lamellibrachiae]|uniref:DUF2335 domain-containing protein n=1 Tax=Aliiroseovarius lamellibrachiae TaxID=1924933 RepID=UPI001BE0A975|nr:DUF2335 domain-containing protein [Aliiroseovarius lamellibrachiae]MBT2130353.1 DUF2335 domain-containing protein [Aliiroseovarius lamellibrachiae]